MKKSVFLASASMMLSFAVPAFAQDAAQPTTGEPSSAAQGAVADDAALEEGEIIITATRRAEALSDVPIAVSAVSAQSLQNSGATDIRALNQLSPSLLVSSTSSEAGGGVARIRGIGTVGDNPGLESSVAVFIDGVYRSRTGSGLTELGEIERIEVLRGPQGTLFGRNASAGLINIITASPKFEVGGQAEATYGNYDFLRLAAGVTGPVIGDTVAARIDGIYQQRDGFLRDVISGRRINDRDRYLVRGQLLIEPNDDLSVRIIGDYADRNEECCGAIYAPLTDYVRAPGTPAGTIGNITTAPAGFASVLRSLRDPAGNPVFINDNINRRETAITPGRRYTQDVRDWGLSGEVKYELGDVNLTSITAYRDYNLDRAQDADFNNFDIFYRPEGYNLRFKTFSQELRAQGSLFDDRVDWLVGGYYANEKLNNTDNLKFGTQFGQYANLTAGGALGANPASAPLVPAFNAAGGFAGLPTFVNLALSANPLLPAAARAAIVAQVQPLTLSDVGVVRDNYRQTSENFALFTHNVINVTDQFSVTLGLRYTNETKTLNASLLSNNNSCAALRTTLTNLAALGTANPALAPATGQVSQILGGLAGIPCLVNLNTTVDGTYRGRKKEDEFSGTAVLSYKFNDDLLAYASYSRGYKAGGFNLDRSALDSLPLTAAQVAEAAAQGANRQNNGRPEVQDLLFEPEFVDSYELGLKFNGREIDVNVALFRSDFEQFQLNTFNGTNFLVENIVACKGALGAPASLPTRGNTITGSCTGGTRPGVRSQGVEVEAFLYPAEDLQVTFGGTYADTKYRERLVGIGGRPIVNDLFRLPGSRLSNAAQYVVSGSTTFTPEIGDTGLRGLLYADFRYQSDINTGSDLDIEKVQDGFITVNARLGLQGPERRWSVELWAQNLLDQDYTQVGFDAPLQPLGGPSGSRVTDRPQGSLFAADRSTALFGRFLAEPRTYGVTVRTRF